MLRIPALLLLALLVACGGSRQASSDPTPQPEQQPAEQDADVDALALPPAPFFDSLIPAEELAAEMHEAADSAADEAVLDALADAEPTDEEAAHADAAIAGADDEKLAEAVTWDIDVETYNSHHRVQWYLDFFQGKGRERMGIWLNRMQRYEPMIRERLAREGMPGDLVYLALIESGFSNTASSRAKAVGMWQFMKGTAKYYDLRVDSWVDDRRDPLKATDAAVRHLRDLNERFGSLYLAAAAYNAGSGRVSRSLRKLRSGPDDNADAAFFRLYDTRLLHRETKDYVPKLIAAALIAKEPARYGFTVTPAEPLVYDSIVVPTMTGLDVIARLADTTVAAIRELNPQFLRLATPPATASVVRLPSGRGPTTVAAYAELPPERRVTFVEHYVQRGETMGGIARKYRVSATLLQEANPRVSPRRLRIGQRLVVPTGGAISSTVARRMSDPKPAAGTNTSGYHRVKWGETLSEIADEYGVSQHDLKTWNKLDARGRIRAGQRLRVTQPGKLARARTHVVRWGDTLSGLAKRYGVSVSELRRANGLSERETLRAGESIRIPG
jgi:membrane-bound lytic murein transglycosylase D